MSKRRRGDFGVSLLNFNPTIRLIAQRKKIMAKLQRISFKMTFDSVPMEIELVSFDNDDPLTFDDAKKAIEYAKAIGFVAPVQWKTPGAKEEIVGKIGTVTEVKKTDPADDRKGFTVAITLDNTEDKIEVKTWVASAFRKGDRVKIIKNDKGYIGAELYDDSPKQTGIPF
jgi:hypothetical protein